MGQRESTPIVTYESVSTELGSDRLEEMFVLFTVCFINYSNIFKY